jgi:cytochrome c
MNPPSAGHAPVPHDLPLPLPLARETLVLILVATFLLHILFVNLMVGGSLFTWVFEWLGVRRKSAAFDRLAHGICQTITVNKSLAVVLGVGPLLVMNLVYTVYFYSANALTGIAWMMVIPSVIGAFLLTYAQKYWWQALAERKGLHLAIGGAALALFLFIPFIFLTNINLMLFPERWGEVRGFLSALLLPNVLPRYVHFLLASCAATALFLVWKARTGAWLESEGVPELERVSLMRRFYGIAFVATAAQFLAGPLLYFTLPGHGVTARVTKVILAGVALGILLLWLLHRERRAASERVGTGLGLIVVVFTSVVTLMGAGRHLFREDATQWHRKRVAEKTADFIRMSEEAREAAVNRGSPAEAVTDPVQLGEATYAKTCAACHQLTGLGLPGVFPPLAGSEWVHEGDPSRLIRIVLHGVGGPLRVQGNLFNALMPGHRDLLDDRALAATLTYVRQAWGNKASPVEPDVVSGVRAGSVSRMTPWNESELGRPR